MPAYQASYLASDPVGFAGMIADMRNRTVISRILGGTVALPFGAIVFRGTTDDSALPLGGTGAGGFLGIAVTDATVPASVAALNAYGVGEAVAVMIKGILWATTTAATTPGAAAYYDALGNITPASSGNTVIPGAVFETSASSGGVAQLRLN